MLLFKEKIILYILLVFKLHIRLCKSILTLTQNKLFVNFFLI